MYSLAEKFVTMKHVRRLTNFAYIEPQKNELFCNFGAMAVLGFLLRRVIKKLKFKKI